MSGVHIRWAIAGEIGLYCGQHLTRKDAISEHVEARYGVGHYTYGRALSATQREMWDKCRAKGDRAVKVRITILKATA